MRMISGLLEEVSWRDDARVWASYDKFKERDMESRCCWRGRWWNASCEWWCKGTEATETWNLLFFIDRSIGYSLHPVNSTASLAISSIINPSHAHLLSSLALLCNPPSTTLQNANPSSRCKSLPECKYNPYKQQREKEGGIPCNASNKKKSSRLVAVKQKPRKVKKDCKTKKMQSTMCKKKVKNKSRLLALRAYIHELQVIWHF